MEAIFPLMFISVHFQPYCRTKHKTVHRFRVIKLELGLNLNSLGSFAYKLIINNNADNSIVFHEPCVKSSSLHMPHKIQLNWSHYS